MTTPDRSLVQGRPSNSGHLTHHLGRRTMAAAVCMGLAAATLLSAAPAQAVPGVAYDIGPTAGNGYAQGVLYAPNGDLYATFSQQHTVIKFPAGGGAGVPVAGTGSPGSTGDNGAATAAALNAPTGMARDILTGDLYISDSGNHKVRKIDGTTGVITTLAGDGNAGNSGDGSGATSARLDYPYGLAYRGGNLYIADTGNDRVRKVNLTSGVISTVVGTAQNTAMSDGNGVSATLESPAGLSWGTTNNLIIADMGHHAIRSYDLTSTAVTTVAGTGSPTTNFGTDGGDGGQAAAATLREPVAAAYDSAGNLLIADGSNARLRRVASDGTISTIAGNGSLSAVTSGPASGSSIGGMYAMAVGSGDVIAVGSNVVRLLGTRPTLTSNTPAAPTAGTPYTHTFTATAIADRNPSWSVAGGSLPTGLTLSSSGVLSGTATASGTFNAVIRAVNGYGAPVDTPITLNVAAAVSAPGQPLAVTTTPGNASAVVSWNAPTSNGGAMISSYTATAYTGSGATFTCTTSTLSCTIHGLAPGTPYNVSVSATNSAGTGTAAGASSTVTPTTPPASGGGGGGGGGVGTPGQQVTTTAPKIMPLGSRTFALNATSTGNGSGSGESTVAGGKLTYTAATPSVCSVDPAGVVTALKAGTCTVTVTAAATTLSASTTKNVDVTIAAPEASVASLPAGAQRFAGTERVATSADIAAKVFPIPAAGTSRDVVIATAGSFADALPGTRLAGQVGGPLLLTNGNQLSEEAAAQVRRLVAQGGTVYLLGGDKALSDAVEKAVGDLVQGDSVVRVGGANRYETAALIADATTKRAGDVGPIYLVTGKDFADGVSIGAYAQSTGGVVLLTDGDKMPAATAKYLADHDPQGDRAVAIGGPAKAAATSAGLTGAASRAVVGADRFNTSAKLATAMKTTTPASSTTSSTTTTSSVASVGLAGGASWPDALSGSAAMAVLGGPLLLTPTGSETVPAATVAALTGLDAQRVLVFGGTSVIPAAAYDRAGALLDS